MSQGACQNMTLYATSLDPTPVGAFGASMRVPSALDRPDHISRPPQLQILNTPLVSQIDPRPITITPFLPRDATQSAVLI